MGTPKNRVGLQPSIRPADRTRTRAAAALLVAGAGLVAISLVLPHPDGADHVALTLTALAMAVTGALVWSVARKVPRKAVHALLAGVSVATCVLIYESGIAVGQYGSIYVWTILVVSCYFPRRVAAAHLGWLLATYGGVLMLVENTAGYSPLTRWLFTAISLTVVMMLITGIVARRARADERARHFFDLSRDMLCTANMDGYFVELNEAWTKNLGYSLEELRSIPFVERVHPDDRERTEVEAGALFEGVETLHFENRYLAKDGTWHWLRWSSQLSPDESLIYGRATDVTELKRIEGEREELLDQVQEMARRDSLTGLPNRRALEEQLPREMARARRSLSPLSLAILDIDHFKAYNDTHGHLAGDEVLRKCAQAWDACLRGEDTIARFGGEEFLVLLPDTSAEKAVEIVERLRTKTPMGQSCSAGLACWDYSETIDDLLSRADKALYTAKAGGRDQLAEASLSR
ncbi:MAG TPA: sensor domain-containing diguanylate cyclase [Solirubrobacterales bacterium]|nr:sensor domain-containing diguanylate cyclase [Solirubrobacterales bacterium]